MLTAAVSNGADAVYFGVPHWNARGRTEDFSFEDVAEMIRYARIRGVRTFLAMNVLRLGARIYDLKKRGFKFKTTMIYKKNAEGQMKKWAQYALEE